MECEKLVIVMRMVSRTTIYSGIHRFIAGWNIHNIYGLLLAIKFSDFLDFDTTKSIEMIMTVSRLCLNAVNYKFGIFP